MIILPLFFIKGNKNKILFLVCILFSFVIFTLPITHFYVSLMKFYFSIITHSGNYGGGPREFINPQSFMNNFLVFIKCEPVLFCTLCLSILILFKQIFQKNFGLHFKILLSLVTVQILDLIMVLKHFSLHYLIPVIPIIVINIFIILQLMKFPEKVKLLIIIPFIIFCFIKNVYLVENKLFISDFYQTSKDEPDCINIYSYGCNSPFYALKMGNEWARNRYCAECEKIYGKQYFFVLGPNQFFEWNNQISINELFAMKRKLLLHYSDSYLPEINLPYKLTYHSPGCSYIENETVQPDVNKTSNPVISPVCICEQR